MAEVDCSPEAVAARAVALRGMGSTPDARFDADLLEALSSALAQAVKERDEARRKAALWVEEGWQDLDAIKAQRDAAQIRREAAPRFMR